MKNTTKICVRLYDDMWLVLEEPLGYLWAQALSSLCVFPSFFPLFLLLCCEADTPLPLWGRVARLLVLVRRCMNQSGDRAAGWMADATARMLFNQTALPSNSQGETLHRQMKERGPSTQRSHAYCIYAGTHVHGPSLIPLISQGATPHV